MTELAALSLVTEARRRGLRAVWDPPRFRGDSEALALVQEVPDTARELLRRAAVFRDQADAWTHAGRPGVPLLTLSEAPEPRLGACLSCGVSIFEGHWRCPLCREALELALELRPPEETG